MMLGRLCGCFGPPRNSATANNHAARANNEAIAADCGCGGSGRGERCKVCACAEANGANGANGAAGAKPQPQGNHVAMKPNCAPTASPLPASTKQRLHATASSSSCPHFSNDFEDDARLASALASSHEAGAGGAACGAGATACPPPSTPARSPKPLRVQSSLKAGSVGRGIASSSSSAFLTKTYSFRRMMSFRNRRAVEFGSVAYQSPSSQSSMPLQFSFLGQIYRKTSTSSSTGSSARKNSRPRFTVEPQMSTASSCASAAAGANSQEAFEEIHEFR